MHSENPAPVIRAFTPDDRAGGLGLRVMAFSPNTSASDDDDAPGYAPDDRRFGAFAADGTLLAHGAAWPFGQWLLGRRVPMAGIGGVTTRMEARGQGLGPRIMRALVDRAVEDGDVLSCLYPTLPGFYASLGWATAGSFTRRRVPTDALATLPRPAVDTPVRPYDADRDESAVMAVIDLVGSRAHGNLDRGEAYHRRLLAPDDGVLQYVAERDGRVIGFVGMEKSASRPEDGHRAFRLDVDDLVAVDHDAWLALWSLVASNAPVCAVTEFESNPHEPLLDLLPRTPVETTGQIFWQARVLDAPGAIAARGWPAGARVTVPLRVRDDWMDRNDGAWVLQVEDGEARLEPGGDGTVELDVGTLSALYTGFAQPVDLAWQGRITGATRRQLDDLATAFRSPAPWLDAYF